MSTQPVMSSSTHSLNSCSGNHKTRLLIGEGNFTYAEALIAKHDYKQNHDKTTSLALSIIATELKDQIYCSDCDMVDFFSDLNVSEDKKSEDKKDSHCSNCLEIITRIDSLREKGVDVILGLDGTKIHERFSGQRFQRIHWNCPHDGSKFQEQTLPRIIEGFFSSCSKIQSIGDRIHITLAQPEKKKYFYQGYVYNIVRAATHAGYTIIRKRKFDQSRYPGYAHTQTKKSEKAAVLDRSHYECSSDEDSSDYE